MFRSRLTISLALLGIVILGMGNTLGQDFPNKPIRILTAAAGGGSDFVARQIAQGISPSLGQPVVVDNRGSGVILNEALAKSPPDGYSLVLSGNSFWVGLILQKTPYDAERDYTPISLVAREVLMVVVHPSLPVKSVRDLIELAKARPGQLNYAAVGNGGPQHLSAELFKSMTGINVVHVPYKAGAQTVTALLSGEVQISIYDVGVVAPQVKVGKLRALAVTSAEPSALAPGLPTVAASGVPGYEYVGMTVLWAPAKTPANIINRINQEVVRALNRPEVKERFLSAGEEIVANSPEQVVNMIKSDHIKVRKLITDAGITVN